ncbi:MAG: hypothetical protein WA144_13255 [Candidatus Methanoperedens sp.]
MPKQTNKKLIKDGVIATRNKSLILFSGLFGSKKTNEILDRTFSNHKVISGILDLEKQGFHIRYGKDGGFDIFKSILKPEIDIPAYKEKFWATVREGLLKFYDEESTDAIIGHYNPLIIDGKTYLSNWFGGFAKKNTEYTDNRSDFVPDDTELLPLLSDILIGTNSKSNPDVAGLYIEFNPFDVLKYSSIEQKIGNKIVKYQVDIEEILCVFIDSYIQVFGAEKGSSSAHINYYVAICD